MPLVSLVICIFNQREYLERLLAHTEVCYDDLVVVHDEPDTTGIGAVVKAAGGRFFLRPPSKPPLQEPHWPFAWEQAKHNWILRLDADEFPSEELKTWLREFRQAPEPAPAVSGFTCIWPLWDGQRAVTRRWPDNRIFLFHRERVRFFGMCEQAPIPDGRCETLNLVLHHQPERKCYGLKNVIFRDQSRRGRAFVARCLLTKPTDLICWRWDSDCWPEGWEQIRRHPWRTAFWRLTRWSLAGLRDQWRTEKRVFPLMAISGPIYHVLLCFKFWQLSRDNRREKGTKFPGNC